MQYLAKNYAKPDHLLSVYTDDLVHTFYPEGTLAKSHRHLECVLIAEKGYWSLTVSRSASGFDFTLGVRLGGVRHFHPKSIRQCFNKWYQDTDEAESQYNVWKSTVLDDLESARLLISSFNPPCHILSVTCGPSSSRLCRKIGLQVRDGVAFWLKDSESFSKVIPFHRRILIPSKVIPRSFEEG